MPLAVTPTRLPDHPPVMVTSGSPVVRAVEVVGDIDVLTAPVLADRIAACLADRTSLIVVVDLRRATFLSAAGLHVLMAADQQAHEQDITLRLVVSTHPIRRVLSITGLDRTLTIYPALEPALAT